jgi:hypothetical protein
MEGKRKGWREGEIGGREGLGDGRGAGQNWCRVVVSGDRTRCATEYWCKSLPLPFQSMDTAARAAEQRCGLQSSNVACRAAMWPAERRCGLQSGDVACRAAMWPVEQRCGLQSSGVASRAAMWLAERRCGLQSSDVACRTANVACRAAMWPAEQRCGLQTCSDVACRAAMWPAEQRCGLQNSQCGLQGSDVACRAVVWPPEQRCGMQMRKCTRTPPSAPPLKTSLLSPTRWQSEWNKAGQPLARPPAAAPPPPLPIA